MMGNTEISITGNLTRDPELRFTLAGNGIPVCNFTVAVTPRERVSESEWKDGETMYWDIVAWRALGEHVAESLKRGDPAMVTGRVKFRNYETHPTDGSDPETRHVHEITADTVSVPLTFHTVTVKRTERSKPADAEANA